MSISVKCSKCEAVLPSEWAHDLVDRPCPSCGSIMKVIFTEIADEIPVAHDNARIRAKDSRFSSKRNPRLDVFTGDDLRKSDAKWLKKERIIDKDTNHYKETVVDPTTGEVVHHSEEQLSEHYGHGAAKFKKPSEA